MGLFKNWLQKSWKNKIAKVPVHVAIIMDGNGRWAKRRGLPRKAGHRAGMDRLRDVVAFCMETGVRYLTVYAFSTENWQRPAEEVDFLMELFEKNLIPEVAKLHQHNVRVRFMGLKEGLSKRLLEMMGNAESLTAHNTALTLNVALNYGGRSEIVAAVKELLRATQNKSLAPENITEEVLANHLFLAGDPDPDLLIRPGGERRISNFLVWQLAYTELYFSDIYWPDFGKSQMIKAFQYYSQRERRFGRIKEVQQDG